MSIGYRGIDTARSYANEEYIGEGIAEALKRKILKRGELFVTSKLKATDAHNYYSAKEAIDKSLLRCRLDYFDLFLLHMPFGDYFSAWQTLEDALIEGKIRNIGVSNFFRGQLVNFIECVHIRPAVDQIEINPEKNQRTMLRILNYYNILPMAYSPLGGKDSTIYDNEVIAEIAKKHGKTPAQVVLRWHIQRGTPVIAKTSNYKRMIENLQVYDYNLDAQEMELIEDLNKQRDTYDSHLAPDYVRARLGR